MHCHYVNIYIFLTDKVIKTFLKNYPIGTLWHIRKFNGEIHEFDLRAQECFILMFKFIILLKFVDELNEVVTVVYDE